MEYDTDMVKYEDFAPTTFDPKGYMLDNRGDWYVLPTAQTRDSGVLEKSNFETATKILGGERKHIVEIHRFGHWGPGWFEIIIVNPKAGKTTKKALGIECSLADYPVLDESDWSAKEWDAMQEAWEYASLEERMEICKDASTTIFAARHDYIPEDVYAEHLGVE